jgi:thioester reductase-like protein
LSGTPEPLILIVLQQPLSKLLQNKHNRCPQALRYHWRLLRITPADVDGCLVLKYRSTNYQPWQQLLDGAFPHSADRRRDSPKFPDNSQMTWAHVHWKGPQTPVAHSRETADCPCLIGPYLPRCVLHLHHTAPCPAPTLGTWRLSHHG